MKYYSISFLLLALSGMGLTARAAPPANDNYTSSLYLGVGISPYLPPFTANGTNVEATLEPTEIVPAATMQKTVWFEADALYSGWMTADTMGSALDTVLAVHQYGGAASLGIIGWDDDSGGSNTSRLTFPVTADARYKFQVGGYAGREGPLKINLDWALPPGADLFAFRPTLEPLTSPVTRAFSLIGATLEAGEPQPALLSSSTWFRWTAPTDGQLTVRTRPELGTVDTVLALYRDTVNLPSVAADLVTFNDDFGGTLSQFTTTVIKGQTYSIQVSNFFNRAPGHILLEVDFRSPGTLAVATVPGGTPVANFHQPPDVRMDIREAPVDIHWSVANTGPGEITGLSARLGGAFSIMTPLSGTALTPAEGWRTLHVRSDFPGGPGHYPLQLSFNTGSGQPSVVVYQNYLVRDYLPQDLAQGQSLFPSFFNPAGHYLGFSGLPAGISVDPATQAPVLSGAYPAPGSYPGIGVLSTGASLPWDLTISSLGAWGKIESLIPGNVNFSDSVKVIGNGASMWGTPTDPPVATVAGAQRSAILLGTDGNVKQRGVYEDLATDLPLPPGFDNVNFLSIASAGSFTGGLTTDGQVCIWRWDGVLINSTAPNFRGMDLSPSGFVALSSQAGAAALQEGSFTTVVDAFPLPHLLVGSVQDVAAFDGGGCALKSDGTVEAWGTNAAGQATVPAGLAGVIAVEAGKSHVLALKSDGTVIAWGANADGQSTVPAGLDGVIEIAAEGHRSLALKSDGTVVTWGKAWGGDPAIPSRLSGVTAIGAGGDAAFSVRGQPLGLTAGMVGQPYNGIVPRRLALATFTATGLPPGLTLSAAGALTGVPTVAGVYPVTFQERNHVNPGTSLFPVHTRTQTATITITNPAADAFLAWQRAQTLWAAGPLPPEAAAGADPDSDGLANLLEFAFGSDPQIFSANPLQSQLQPGPVPDFTILVLTVSVPIAQLPHLTLRAEFSDTPDFTGAMVCLLSPIPGAAPGYQLLTCSDPLGSRPRRFARIVASLTGG